MAKTAFIVLATNTNQENFAFGPFSSFEKAQEAKFAQDGKDRLHQHQVLQVLDHEKPLPSSTHPLYERDMEKKVLRDIAVEEMEDEPPFTPAEQPDAPEEEPADEDANVDLTSGSVGVDEGGEDEDEDGEDEEG